MQATPRSQNASTRLSRPAASHCSPVASRAHGLFRGRCTVAFRVCCPQLFPDLQSLLFTQCTRPICDDGIASVALPAHSLPSAFVCRISPTHLSSTPRATFCCRTRRTADGFSATLCALCGRGRCSYRPTGCAATWAQSFFGLRASAFTCGSLGDCIMM